MSLIHCVARPSATRSRATPSTYFDSCPAQCDFFACDFLCSFSARIVNRIYGQRIASTNCSAVSKTNWSSSPTAPRHRDQRRISRAVGGLSSANSAQHFVAQARLHITARPNNNQWQHAQKQQRAWPTPSVWGGTDSRLHRPAPIARRQVQLSNAKAQLYDHTAPAACASQITRTLILPRRALAVRRER